MSRSDGREGSTDVLYVAGSGRSGSTLLDRLLDAHPQIRGVGEVHRLSLKPRERTCGCGEPLLTCRFWDEIASQIMVEKGINPGMWPEGFPVSASPKRAAHGPGDLTLFDALLLLGSTRVLRLAARFCGDCARQVAVGENSWFLYDVIARDDDVELVVDSTKNAGRMKLLYLLRPENLRILHLVRDGQAVASSARRRTGVSIAEGAASWKRANRNVELSLATVPRRKILRVRYEDLCDHTEDVLSRICDFVGLEFTQEMLSLQRTDYHQIPGNPMLHRGGDMKVVKDTRWLEELSAEDRREFGRVAGALNRRYGYQ